MFDQKVTAAATAHALRVWPKEACGIVVGGLFMPMENISDTPENAFRMDTDAYAGFVISGSLQAIIHSHPGGQDTPSKMDMEQQWETSVPWGVIVLQVVDDVPYFKEAFWFGDQCPTPPLKGRTWRHGVTDCYAEVRDYYHEKRKVLLPQFPRDDMWWVKGENLLGDSFAQTAFKKISVSDIDVDDVLLLQIDAKVVNHCAIYMGKGLMLHHLYGYLSVEEPVDRWMKMTRHVLRYPS